MAGGQMCRTAALAPQASPLAGSLAGPKTLDGSLAGKDRRRLPAGVLATMRDCVCARYFTFNASHFVVTAACRAVLAITALIR